MSLAQACAAAQAAILRAQALFGENAATGPGALETAATLTRAQRQARDTVAQMGDMSGELPDAHWAFVTRSATTLGADAGADDTIGSYLTRAEQLTQSGRTRLQTIADQNRATVRAAVTAKSPASHRVVTAELHTQVAQTHALVNGTHRQGTAIAAGIRSVSYGQDLLLSPPPKSPTPPLAPTPEADRRRNQIEAFKNAFGREPTSPSDWTTAAALDPHSYDPKNAGVPPNIVVGRIKPVAGQGVVRTSLFIPGQKAWTPFGDNLGDNRGFDPQAGPEESRVTIYTDYDNGIVVARQNPSVMEMPGGGFKRAAGTPDIQVSQNPNGSVLIKYQAADPFSPGGQDIAKATPWNVNGSLVIKPTPSGPVAGGLVTEFPAIEIYNDNAGHTADLGHIMPRNTTVFGPLAGLPFSQQIGPQLMTEFPDTIVPGAQMPPPPIPPHGGLHPPPVVRIPTPVIIPYPSVTLGDVANPPQVPIGH